MALKKKKNVPVEEEIKEEVAPVEEVEETVEEVKEEKVDHVTVAEEKKQFSALQAPEEIRKIIEFYWITSQDLFDGKVEDMWLKADELKAIKEWYATLA